MFFETIVIYSYPQNHTLTYGILIDRPKYLPVEAVVEDVLLVLYTTFNSIQHVFQHEAGKEGTGSSLELEKKSYLGGWLEGNKVLLILLDDLLLLSRELGELVDVFNGLVWAILLKR